MAEELVFPRIVYRGDADTLGTGTVGETKRVDSQLELDDAKKDGWRLTRDDATHKAREAPGRVRVPAQSILADTTAANLVDANRDAALGGPSGGPGFTSEAHPATAKERAKAVQVAEADAAAADPARGAKPSAAPKRNATKK